MCGIFLCGYMQISVPECDWMNGITEGSLMLIDFHSILLLFSVDDAELMTLFAHIQSVSVVWRDKEVREIWSIFNHSCKNETYLNKNRARPIDGKYPCLDTQILLYIDFILVFANIDTFLHITQSKHIATLSIERSNDDVNAGVGVSNKSFNQTFQLPDPLWCI